MGRKPLSNEILDCTLKAFAGLENSKIVEEAEKRYNYLWQKHSSRMSGEKSGSREAMRFTFENSDLVYIPKERDWRPPSQCVWVESSIRIPGKASVADVYPLKKTFFTEVLRISEPTVEMYVDSLINEAKGEASVAKIKETMALICGLGIGKTDLSSLVEARILPVKSAAGISSFASAISKTGLVDFVIMENTIHWNAFKNKTEVLDFSLEEVRDTRPLLLAMGLQDRFSSKQVKEVTDVSGGSRDHGMTRNLRTKSQAIVRYVILHQIYDGTMISQ